MPVINIARRLPAKTISADIDSYNGLGTVSGYVPVRAEATPETLKANYEAMLAKQQKETELQVMVKAAADEAKRAEWEFHNSVLAMKEAVRAQFGPDSNNAQAIGYKKKSEYKRRRRASSAAM